MRTYALRHLADSSLRHGLKQLVTTDWGTAATAPAPQVALGQSPVMAGPVIEVGTAPVHSSAPARIDDPVISVVTPLAPEHYAWQLTVSHETQDLLREVQNLLGHEVPSGDLEAVLKFALRTARQKLEQRKDLQFDHTEPYTRGGEATAGGIRLLCRAHNRFEAERSYGAEFMRHKREAARHRASEDRATSSSPG